MWLDETFNLKYPIIQGGMSQVATPEFAAAVSNAGALGSLGTGSLGADAVREWIHKTRELTDKPFSVNIMLMNPEAEAIAQVVAEEKVAAVTTGAGSPAAYVPMWQEAGVKVIPVVASLMMAQRMQRIGVDAVVAEGQEAGGHIGEQTSMTLWPLLARNLDIPVIAAGGIAHGEEALTAEVMGCEGMQIGTLFLATEECPIHQNYKDALVKARESKITTIGRISGVPCRCLKNRMTRQYLQEEKAGADVETLERFTVGALRRAVVDGDTKEGNVMLGLAAAAIDDILPLKERLDRLMAERDAAYERLVSRHA